MPAYQPLGRQLFYVVFSDRLSQNRHWWHLFLRPGFFHVWVMRKPMAGTVVFHPFHRTWQLDWVPMDIEQVVGELIADGRHRVLLLDRPGDGRYNRLCPLHCVNVVKACIGVKSRAVTPFQLYRDLLQMGAVEITT